MENYCGDDWQRQTEGEKWIYSFKGYTASVFSERDSESGVL